MTAPATEKAAPIPAEVLAERLRGMMKMAASSEDGFNHLTPAACRLLTRVHEALDDRASQEERIREDEREALARHMAAEFAQHEIGYDWELTDRIWQEGWRKAADRALAAIDRARLRGDAS